MQIGMPDSPSKTENDLKPNLTWYGSGDFKFSSSVLTFIGILACFSFPVLAFFSVSEKDVTYLLIAFGSGISGVIILFITSLGRCLVEILEGVYKLIDLQKSSVNDK